MLPCTHFAYLRQFYFWEILECSRRIVLTGWVALIPERLAFLRLVVGVLTSISALLLTLATTPCEARATRTHSITARSTAKRHRHGLCTSLSRAPETLICMP